LKSANKNLENDIRKKVTMLMPFAEMSFAEGTLPFSRTTRMIFIAPGT
jgi:hypothetical protein